MILTCPECATSYFVDDSRIPPQGRRVRCSSCGHRWSALPDGSVAESAPAETLAELEPEAAAPPPPEIPQPEAFDEAELGAAASEPEAVPEAEPELVVEPVPRPRRPPPPSRTAGRGRAQARSEARSSAMLWAGMAAVAAALIASAIVFRSEVVRLWPKSSAAYAGLGLSVDGGGLVFEQVRADPAFLGGRPVLSVTGAIRNIRDEDLNSPPLRISLLNRDGKPVSAKIARPLDPRVPARSRRHFAIAILDPPANARDLEVRFEGQSDKTAAHAKAVVTPVSAPAAPPPAAAPVAGGQGAGAPVAGAPVAGAPAAPAPTSIGALTEHG